MRCFVCWRKLTNYYQVDGVFLCSTCSAQKAAERSSQVCKRCGLRSQLLVRTSQGRLCPTCREAASGSSPEDDLMLKMAQSAADKFYKSGREGEYYQENPAYPLLQSFVHLALILALAVHASMLDDPLLSAIEGALSLALAILLICFFTVRIKVYDDEVRLLYGPFTYQVKKKDFEKVEISGPSKALAYGLLPWRDSHGWLLMFLMGPGPAIIIRKKKGLFRSVMVTSADPVNLLQQIAKRL